MPPYVQSRICCSLPSNAVPGRLPGLAYRRSLCDGLQTLILRCRLDSPSMQEATRRMEAFDSSANISAMQLPGTSPIDQKSMLFPFRKTLHAWRLSLIGQCCRTQRGAYCISQPQWLQPHRHLSSSSYCRQGFCLIVS